VLFDEGWAAEALKPGTVALIMATVGAEAVISWAERLAARERTDGRDAEPE